LARKKGLFETEIFYGFPSILTIFLFDLLAMGAFLLGFFLASSITIGVGILIVSLLEYKRFPKAKPLPRVFSTGIRALLAGLVMIFPTGFLGVLALIGFLLFFGLGMQTKGGGDATQIILSFRI